MTVETTMTALGRPLSFEGRQRDAAHWDDRRLDSYPLDAARSASARARVAVVDGDTRLTYAQLADLILRTAAGLAHLGVAPGDTVSWQLPNWWEAIVIHHGILRAGAVSNPLMPILRERELRFMLRQARSKVLVVPEVFRRFDFATMANRIAADLPDLEHTVIVRPSSSHARSFHRLLSNSGAEDAPETGASSANSAALLLYTSGTESSPKGVIHTHNTIGYENRSLIELFGLGSDDVVFMPSPLPHITGIAYGIHLAPMLGACVALQDIWEPARALELIERERCTFTVAATPFLHMMASHPDLDRRDVSSLRIFGCGGADVSPALVHTATERLGTCVVRLYGSTEFPTVTAGRPDDSLERRASTDGRPIGDTHVRCVDAQGSDVPAGEVGELIVRGPEQFLGYLDDAANAASLTCDGWFRTGDLAAIEDDGSIVIRGRQKDIVVRGGENISVKEVEDLLLEDPRVKEVAIVAMPDPVMVERMCAFVVPERGSDPTLQELNDRLQTMGIMRQKLPERLELVRELPKTASGKIQKFELRAQISAAIAAQTASPSPPTPPASPY